MDQDLLVIHRKIQLKELMDLDWLDLDSEDVRYYELDQTRWDLEKLLVVEKKGWCEFRSKRYLIKIFASL